MIAGVDKHSGFFFWKKRSKGQGLLNGRLGVIMTASRVKQKEKMRAHQKYHG